MHKYICKKRGVFGGTLNAADFLAGVRDIVDLGGETNHMDFYFTVFSGGQTLTQNGTLYLCCFKRVNL